MSGGAALLIAVVGGSGSGKTTLAHALAEHLGSRALGVSEDWYYRDPPPDFDPATFDFDDVAARDHELLAEHLAALKAGRPVAAPVYDFVTHHRAAETLPLAPAPVVVADGAHLLCTPALAALFDLKVFVDTPADVRFIRRLIRDQRHRGRTAESVVGQYLLTVRPGHLRWIEPSRALADLILYDGDGEVEQPDPAKVARLLAPLLADERLTTL